MTEAAAATVLDDPADRVTYRGIARNGTCQACQRTTSDHDGEEAQNFKMVEGQMRHNCALAELMDPEQPLVPTPASVDDVAPQVGAITVHHWPVKEIRRGTGKGAKPELIRTEKPTFAKRVEFLGVFGPHAILRFGTAGEYRFSVESGMCVDGKEMRDWVIDKTDLRRLRKVKADGSARLSFSDTGRKIG